MGQGGQRRPNEDEWIEGETELPASVIGGCVRDLHVIVFSTLATPDERDEVRRVVLLEEAHLGVLPL